MKTNPDTFQFIILVNKGSHTLQFDDVTAKSISSVKLLGITIDSKLNFEELSIILEKKHIINCTPSED